MARSALVAVVLSAILVAMMPGMAAANCPAPDRPAVEKTEMSTRLNTYAEGAGFCVAAKTEYCPECEAGWWHVCKNGHWVAEHYRACPDPAAATVTPGVANRNASFLPLGDGAPSANPPGASGSVSRGRDRSNGGDPPPVSGACRLTNTC